MSNYFLSKDEKYKLQRSSLKIARLQIDRQIEQINYDNIIRDFCNKNGLNYDDIVKVDPDSGLIEIKKNEKESEDIK